MPTQADTFLVHVGNAPPVCGLVVLLAQGLALWAGHVVAVLAAVGGVSPPEELAVTPAVTNPTLIRDSCAWCYFLSSSKNCFILCLGCFLLYNMIIFNACSLCHCAIHLLGDLEKAFL